MYVHIGGDRTLSDRLIVGIFHFDGSTGPYTDRTTRRFLAEKEAQGLVTVLGDDLPKSFIVTLEGVYLSPVSVQTLYRRLSAGQIV